MVLLELVVIEWIIILSIQFKQCLAVCFKVSLFEIEVGGLLSRQPQLETFGVLSEADCVQQQSIIGNDRSKFLHVHVDIAD